MNLNLYNDEKIVDAGRENWVKDLVKYTAEQLELDDNVEVSIHFVSKDEIQKINREYRDKDRATDVISFAIEDEDSDEINELLAEEGMERDIGDLFISPEIVEEHAKEYEHSVDRELGYTIVHGILHLNGYDHIDPDDEKKMIGLQNQILDGFGLTK